MYVEVFLLDNLLLNLLIMRLAAAILSLRPPIIRTAAVCTVSAAAAALAAYRFPVLRNVFLRLPLLFIMAAGLPVSGARGAKRLGVFLLNSGAVLLSSVTVGGCAAAITYILDGSPTQGTALRTAVLTALAASFLPAAARRLLRRRLKNERTARVLLLHDGSLRSFTALVDTGNTLSEPVSGLPVAVVRCEALKKYAVLPIPTQTAAGRVVLLGFIPDRLSVNGREVACAVAVAGDIGAEALIPPDLLL